MGRVAAVLLAASCLLLPVASGQQSERDRAEREEPIVYTNADLPPAPPSSGPAAATPAPQAATVDPLPVIDLSYGSVRDRNGHGEGWWRRRAAEMDVRVAAALLEAQKLHVAYVRGKEITDATLKARSREATLRLKELEAERERLPEALRQAGGLPGWLRRGTDPLPVEDLAAPVGLDVNRGDTVTLSWKAVRDARFYLVEAQCLDCCGLLGPCDLETLDASGTSVQFPSEAEGTLRWRVLSLDEAGFPGEWSDWSTSAPTADE